MINNGPLGEFAGQVRKKKKMSDFAGQVRKKRPRKRPVMTSIPDPRGNKPTIPKQPTPTAEALKPNVGPSTTQSAKNVANMFKANLIKAKVKKTLT